MRFLAILETVFFVTTTVFGGTLYLSPEGSDETGDGTSAAPLRNLKTAVAAAEAAIEGGETEMTIYLAPGQYPVSDGPAIIASPIKLIGQGSIPADVVVRASYTYNWDGSLNASVLTLNHADARLENLRVTDGFCINWGGFNTRAAGIHISAGMVTNCVVSNCHGAGNQGYAGCVYLGSSDAVLTHSTIYGGYVTHINPASWGWHRVGGVWMDAGRMENCLIRGCHIDDTHGAEFNFKYVGGLLMKNGTAVNCTIIGNRAHDAGGVLAEANATLYNCVIAHNTIQSPDEDTGENDHACLLWSPTSYHNCASDTTAPIRADQQCVIGAAEDLFADYDAGDYSPKFGSVLIDGGDLSAVTEATDLVGEQRVKGWGVDIGAYEAETRIAITVTIETSEFGSVSVSDGPYYAGETITLSATPNEGCDFLGWEGDVPAALVDSASVSFAPSANCTIHPRFAPTGSGPIVYVSTTGSDANSGFSENEPKATVRSAVATLEGSWGYGTVSVAEGTYHSTYPFVVTRAVKVIGAGSTPAGVVLHNSGHPGGAGSDNRVAALDNPGAAIINVTFDDGFLCDWGGLASTYGFLAGANVSIYAGVVSNCVIQNGHGQGWWARSAGAYVGGANALLTHSIIRNNHYTQAEADWGGLEATGGVRIEGGRVENCLIYGNSVNDTMFTSSAGGVRVFWGTLANCTVYNNSGIHVGGVNATGDAQIRNVVLFGNTDGGGAISPWGGSAARFDHCATDGDSPINDACILITQTAFSDYAAGNLTPRPYGPLYNAGSNVTLSSATDFAGNPRVCGIRIDIGAFESQFTGTTLFFR